MYGDLLEEAHDALVGNHQWLVRSLADGLVQQHGLKMGRASGEYRRLCRELLKARVSLYQEEMRRMDGQYTPDVTSSPRPAPAPVVMPSVELRTAFDSYMSQHTYRRPATQQDIQQTLNEFLQMSGLDWTTADVRRDFVKATCTKWKDQQLTKVSARSFNKKHSYLQHFFRWMVTHDQLEKNPLEGLSVAARQQKMESTVRNRSPMNRCERSWTPYLLHGRGMLASGVRSWLCIPACGAVKPFRYAWTKSKLRMVSISLISTKTRGGSYY